MSLARLLRIAIPEEPVVAEPTAETGDDSPIAAVLSGIRKPAGVQAAMAAVEAARQTHFAAHAARLALGSQRGSKDAADGPALAAAGAAEDAAKQALRTRKAELRAAIEAWAPALRRLLAPHRAQAAQRIVAAVDEVEAALATIGPCDGFVAKWAIEAHPPLRMDDLRALRHSAERIVAVEGDR